MGAKKLELGKRVQLGLINLADNEKVDLQEGQGVLFKKALILFEGTFQGMFGPVTITPEFIQLMADRFNRDYANPKNMFDYPPILVDHNRSADLTMGRLVGPLEVMEFEDPRDGNTKKVALFGDIRIDDEDAQGKVIKGKYAHMSLSFDDDMENLGEIFELSFVAVEAARGAQALEKGENMSVELKKELADSKKKSTNLSKLLKDRRTVLLASCKSLSTNLKALSAAHKQGTEDLKAILVSLKTGVVKSQLTACVKEGRLSKAEFDKIDIEKISLMPAESQVVVLSSYQNRAVSTDLIQHGMDGAKPLAEQEIQLTSAQLRKAITDQKSGVELSGPVAPAVAKNLAAGDEDDDTPDPELTGKDIEEALAKLEGLSALQEKIGEGKDRMTEILSKLQGDDKDDNDNDGED